RALRGTAARTLGVAPPVLFAVGGRAPRDCPGPVRRRAATGRSGTRRPRERLPVFARQRVSATPVWHGRCTSPPSNRAPRASGDRAAAVPALSHGSLDGGPSDEQALVVQPWRSRGPGARRLREDDELTPGGRRHRRARRQRPGSG